MLIPNSVQLVWENRKLDKLHGSNKNRMLNQSVEGQESEVGEENYGPTFRVRTFLRWVVYM